MATPSPSLLHGTSGLTIVYALTLAAMLVVLVRRRAAARTLWLSPLWALPVMILTQIIVSVLEAPLTAQLAAHRFLVYALYPINALLSVLVAYAVGIRLARYRPNPLTVSFRRGAVVTAVDPSASRPDASRASAATGGAPAALTLADVPIPIADETKHFKLIGTTGTGKSTAIRELLAGALRRGDGAIIADPDGGYLARFYDAARGDVILNPFDGDARRWDLFSEITHEYDVEQLARSLIPDQGNDPVWPGYARTLFSAVAHRLFDAGTRNDAELYELLTRSPQNHLRVMLDRTVAGPFLEPGNEKMFGSIRSVLTSALSALDYTTRQQAEPFSVRQWVRTLGAPANPADTTAPAPTPTPASASASAPPPTPAPAPASPPAPARRGVLFLPYKAGEIAALRSVISAWLRLAIFEAMDGDERDQRLWFIVDELDALGQIDGLKDALARLRKFGGRCVLGLQSIAQVSSTYGRGNAETIIENCANTLILRCSASEQGGTAEFASRLIGQREIIYRQRSRTRDPGKWRPSVTTSEQLRAEPAILASQIERLPDLAGYLKLASVPDWQTVTLTPAEAAPRPRTRRPSILTKPAIVVPTPPLAPSSAAPLDPPPSPPPTARPSRRRAPVPGATVSK